MRLVYVSTGTSTHSRMLSSMRAIGRERVARADPHRASIISPCSRINIRSSDSRESRECRLGDASRKLQAAEERERSERSSGSSEAFRECGMMQRVLKRILRASSLSIPLDSARFRSLPSSGDPDARVDRPRARNLQAESASPKEINRTRLRVGDRLITRSVSDARVIVLCNQRSLDGRARDKTRVAA